MTFDRKVKIRMYSVVALHLPYALTRDVREQIVISTMPAQSMCECVCICVVALDLEPQILAPASVTATAVEHIQTGTVPPQTGLREQTPR